MGLEQLRQPQTQTKPDENATTLYPESLVVTLRAFAHHDAKIHLLEEKEEAPPVICSDGYIRRSPIQPLWISPAYQKRRKRLLTGLGIVAGIGIGILICAVIITVAALLL